jgi:hypothetical protein
MVTQPSHHPRYRPQRGPTSREINQAIEVLREAGIPDSCLRTLDLWNAARLVEAAHRVETHEELANLFAGRKPLGRPSFSLDADSEGAWS